MRRMKLISVYQTKDAEKVLYRLLKEREKKSNISHRLMPSYSKHCQFVRSKPYKVWYLLCLAAEIYVGGIYLSKNSEIGLFIFKEYQKKGFGREALHLLMRRHKGVRRFLANVSPGNTPSISFFKHNGFKHIQNTYEFERSTQ